MTPPLLAIFTWPLISIIFFRTMRLPLAVIVTVLGGYLLLPENTAWDLPVLPGFDKDTVPVLSALILGSIFMARAQEGNILQGLLPGHWIARLLLLVLALSAFLTVITNPDGLTYPTRFLPGLSPYDAFSAVSGTIMMALPLLLARKYLASPATHRLLLVAFCAAGLAYSLPALFEVRMSPQLNNWVYGFFPHSWAQHFRSGGWRPVVFLQHGLFLGIFLSMAVLATTGLIQMDKPRRGKLILASVWLLATLLLSKNLGATMITLILLPVALFLGTRGQFLVAAVIAGVFLSYPLLRSAHVLPIEQITELVEDIDPQRASSFLTRLENEERMLAKAFERPFFGWGGWGRSRVYDETGNDITIADGYWIIALGVDGWFGYLSRMGLLTAPVFLLILKCRRDGVGMESSILALILAANLIDMVPNSSITPLSWLLAGALWGRVEFGKEAAADMAPIPGLPHHPDYRRAAPAVFADAPSGDVIASAPQSPYTRQKQRIDRRRIPRTEASR